MVEDSNNKDKKSDESRRSNYVSGDAPGSDTDTREIPVLKDKDETDEASKGHEGSLEDTRADEPDEFDSRISEPAEQSGEGNDWSVADLPDDPDEDTDDEDDETVIATRPMDVEELTGRKVGREEWRDRAAEAAQALGEPDDWGDADERESLAKSVAAAGKSKRDTGEPTRPVMGSVLEHARAAQREWAELRFEQRLPKFRALQKELVQQRADYVPSMATTIGRPMVETLTGEYLPVLEALRLLEDIFPPLLADWHAGEAPPTVEGMETAVRRRPWGVVVICNGASTPFAFPMTMILDALAAGNAVIFCAAHEHPRITEMMRKMLRRAGFPEHLVQVVAGDPASLAGVIEAQPDKVIYYGPDRHTPTLAAACAESTIEFQPLRFGKDILAVLPDAPLDRAAHAAMWGAFAGAGMLPASIERLVVAEEVYDEFRVRFFEAVREMNSHHAQLASTGESFQMERFQALLNNAADCGARVTWPAGEAPGRWIHWKGVVIENLPAKALLASQRSDGPAVAMYRSDSVLREILRLQRQYPAASLSVFGVPSKELRTSLDALPIARISYQETFPLSGSGAGWPMGPDLPRTICSPLAMLRPQVVTKGDGVSGRVAWFPYTDDKAYALMDAIEAVYGTEAGKRIKAAFKLALNPQKRRVLRGDDS